ncbi:Bax inhibitor-1/YccA family protein [Zhihengliuella halotolerans]|uniref:Putative YccA/Bax inhibitor family protein n=1 Tax=Zhihengliuella halotolerans TaxID=370736 RepID=A0A4V2G9X5_9MICC|nr:Bax inhibitor-1/YccA family protein [Zhihengliuella halotolerans]RZU62116.1 putative YccA/Bax inhibitor family protein [Zhihengliuella halotolerans]
MALGGNPVFSSRNFREQTGGGVAAGPRSSQDMSADQLRDLYSQPSASPAQTGRMTYGDVINKTILCFVGILAGAVVGWQLPGLMLIGLIVGLVLGLVNSFKKEPSPALIMLYAVAEGLFLGGLTGVLNAQFPGIATQALAATLSVFAVTLVLYRSGKYRATPKMTRIFMIAMGAYLVFSLVNLGLMMFGAIEGMFGMRDGVLGLVIGALAVLLATYALVLDFTSIQQGVENGAPAKYSWSAAFGLTVTMVWLYVEILRIIAILRGDD